MRYTPFLDAKRITFNEESEHLVDNLVNIIDSCLAAIEQMIDWGEYEGRQRKPCPEQSVLLAGQPLGQYHCPYCGMMLIAGLPHFSPSPPKDIHPDYPDWHYEDEYGVAWPPGYEEEDVRT